MDAQKNVKTLKNPPEVGIIYLNQNLKVQWFNQKVLDVFDLTDSDKGCPLKKVSHRLNYDSFFDDTKQFRKDNKPVKKLLCHNNGTNWYVLGLDLLQVDGEGVEGILLTLMEVTELKNIKQERENLARQEDALAQLGLYALDDKKVEEVIHRSLQIICEILKMDFCLLHELNYKENMFCLIEAIGPGFEGNCPENIKKDNTLDWDVGFALDKKDFLAIENYEEENRFELLPVLEDYVISSGVNVIVDGTQDVYGVLSAYSTKQRAFSEHDVSFLRVIANMIGESIDRRRANQQLEETNKQLLKQIRKSKQYQREILNNSVAERWQLGGFLHDNLAQKLVSVKMMLKDLEDQYVAGKPDISKEVETLNAIIDEGIEGIRDITHDIVPIDIEEEGVEHAFRFLMHQTQKLHGINCILETGDIVSEIKNRKLATNLYHVVQEAVKNAAVHGKAKNISVSITKPKGDLVLAIKDDGVGMSDATEGINGKGLRIMKHRMELLGGTFKIEDRPDSNGDKPGMQVICTIPQKYLAKKKRGYNVS